MDIKENYREKVVTDLVRTVLGPRYGLKEILSDKLNPVNLYITGVLAPEDETYDLDSENDLSQSAINHEEDNGDEKDVDNPVNFVPALDSKSRPKSFGISFLIRTGSEVPKMHICFSWARYIWLQEWEKFQQMVIKGEIPGFISAELNSDIKMASIPEEAGKKLDSIKKKSSKENINTNSSGTNNSVSTGTAPNVSIPSKPAKTGWQRDPRFLILGDVAIPETNLSYYQIPSQDIISTKVPAPKEYKIIAKNFDTETFTISIRVSKLFQEKNQNIFKISIYFVNNAYKKRSKKKKENESGEDKKKDNPEGDWVTSYVFQPEIRVIVSETDHLMSYNIEYQSEKPKIEIGNPEPVNIPEECEEQNDCDDLKPVLDEFDAISKDIEILYRSQVPYARGHMCSAVWRENDPQRIYEISAVELKDRYGNAIPFFWKKNPTDPTKYHRMLDRNFPPFYWIDGELLPKLYEGIFRFPNVRSEFTPIIPVYAPDFIWREFTPNSKLPNFIQPEVSTSPTFMDAEYIAENGWDKNIIIPLLKNIATQYQNWINLQQNEADHSDPSVQHLATVNLPKHQQILDRINEGIAKLDSDEQLRLAFCFANKAIVRQFRWREKDPNKKFYWRSFQIGFVLMSLPSIVDKNITNTYRDEMDLLWVPTGGGKTEAYLFLAAFVLAYRRRLATLGDKNTEYELGNGNVLLSRYTLRLLTIQQFRRALKLITACETLRLGIQVIKNELMTPQSSNNNHITNYFQKQVPSIGWIPAKLQELLNKNELPKEWKSLKVKCWIWGSARFTLGLWVGGALTPNRLKCIPLFPDPVYQALDALHIDEKNGYISPCHPEHEKRAIDFTRTISDPAQVLSCPACGATLTLVKKEDQLLPQRKYTLFYLVKKETGTANTLENEVQNYINLTPPGFDLQLVRVIDFSPKKYILKMYLNVENKELNCRKLRNWLYDCQKTLKYDLLSADYLNPGYFINSTTNDKKGKFEYNFEIRCLDPTCDLFINHCIEEIPLPESSKNEPYLPNEHFQTQNNVYLSRGIPIPAFTIDEQIYRYLPSMIIGTVDKYAQLPYRDDAGAMFGNVEIFHPLFGFGRRFGNERQVYSFVAIRGGLSNLPAIEPPELILQDELHLIEGPLGSLVGIYEILIDQLCSRYDSNGKRIRKVKYIASTATIRSGKEQVSAIYERKLNIFPAEGITDADSFFVYYKMRLYKSGTHPLEESSEGRIYLGMAAPGKSSQTPLTRVWSSLFQTTLEIDKLIHIAPIDSQKVKELDRFWTVVGYFNTIKELASIRAVYNQDFISWMRILYGDGNFRKLKERKEEPIELCGWTDSVLLPEYMDRLEGSLTDSTWPVCDTNAINGVLTTSMFGTGVDVSRLGLMVMNGQPKTTGSYIQSTGRIGRSGGGLIIAFLHAGRPRDLDHYEQFAGYHMALYKYVEPITVMPFAPDCLNECMGPVGVALVRHSEKIEDISITERWRGNTTGPQEITSLGNDPANSPLINKIASIFFARWRNQPIARKTTLSQFRSNEKSFKDAITYWKNHLQLQYKEVTLRNSAEKSVVLGSPAHESEAKRSPNKIFIVYHNVLNSFRGVEATTTFGTYVRPVRSNDKR